MGSVRGINHVDLTVSNIDETTQFFKEAFGAKVAYDGLSMLMNIKKGQKLRDC